MALKQWPFEQMKEMLFSTFYLSLFFFISVLYVGKLTKKTKSKTNLNLPPSPPRLPLIGNLHQFGTLPHRSLRDLSLKYGDIMLLQLGQMQNPTVVVSSVDVAMEIIKTHDLAFSNRPQNTAAKILLYGSNNIAFALYGESWRLKRKICILELLSTKRVQSLSHIREEEVAKLVNKLREVSSSDECYVNLSDMLMSTSNNVVCKCALGRKYKEDGYSRIKELARNVMVQLTAFTVGDYFPLLGWVDILTGKIQEYKDTFHALDALFEQTIEEHLTEKREGDHSKKKDFVDILLQLQQNNFQLTKNDLKAILLDMFVGGTDTAVVTLEWAISELVKNPTIMKKVQEEVRKIVGHKSNVEENDINQMHYLKCVVKETLRLHPPATLLAPRETISSVKVKGYDIPAKTVVYINAWAIQRDPEFWESPEEFLPERFEKSEVDFKGQHFQFIPFGFGRRGCPGMSFGVVFVEYVLACLLYWFDWKLPESDALKQDIDMSEKFGLVVSKKTPLYLKPETF
ncbi:Cytochrome P450 71A1, partial [Mucuna pruriens]